MVPHISDKGRRTLRTVLQVLAAFGTFAAAYPALVAAIGAPTGSHVGQWLATAGVWIAATSAIITRLMAIPGVDQILTLLGVGSIPRSSVQVSLKTTDGTADAEQSLFDESVSETAAALDPPADVQPAAAVAPVDEAVAVPGMYPPA